MGNSKIASVLFSTKEWTDDRAKVWLKKHGFKSVVEVGETGQYHRYRQLDPTSLKRGHYGVFRTIEAGKGIKFVLAVRTAAAKSTKKKTGSTPSSSASSKKKKGK
jgi:hypothetical protein